MDATNLRAALETEHHTVDRGLEAYVLRPGLRASEATLRGTLQALRRHIHLEEDYVFPRVRAAGVLAPVLVMLREHGELWWHVDELDRMLDAGAPPDEIRTSCQTLLAQLDRHDSKEEPIIYSQLAEILTPDDVERIVTFMESGTVPEGWTAQMAE